MKIMEERVDKFLDGMLPDYQTWNYEETRELLKKLYLRMFFYDIPNEEIEQWIIDLYNMFQKEFE